MVVCTIIPDLLDDMLPFLNCVQRQYIKGQG